MVEGGQTVYNAGCAAQGTRGRQVYTKPQTKQKSLEPKCNEEDPPGESSRTAVLLPRRLTLMPPAPADLLTMAMYRFLFSASPELHVYFRNHVSNAGKHILQLEPWF